MKTVNKYFLDDIISPLSGGVDFDEFQHLQFINANDELVVKNLIKQHITPYFEQLSVEYIAKLKISLAYFLQQNKIDFERIIESNLLPINTPSSPEKLFIWIWETFFPNESFLFIPIENCVEKNDQFELLRLCIRLHKLNSFTPLLNFKIK